MQMVTVPLIRSVRIERKWHNRGSEVMLPVSEARRLAQGNSPKIDAAALEKALAGGKAKPQGKDD